MYPVIYDSKGVVLSMPPIINGWYYGSVFPPRNDHFIASREFIYLPFFRGPFKNYAQDKERVCRVHGHRSDQGRTEEKDRCVCC